MIGLPSFWTSPRPARPWLARATTGAVMFVAVVFWRGELSAQSPPRLDSLSREWIQRGSSMEITFRGTNLSTATRFVFDGEPGLSATNIPPMAAEPPAVRLQSSGGISSVTPGPARDETRLKVRVTATPEAPFGSREVRVVTPSGISNPQRIRVGQWPEVQEKAPNNSVAQAQAVTLPASINGIVAAAAEADFYRFAAKKGEEIIVDVEAARIGSVLDSSMALLDAQGQELVRNEDYAGFDSHLAYTVPADGDLILQIRDYRFQGGGNHKYRVTAGAVPFLDSVFPFGGRRGSRVEVALQGRNLEGVAKMTLEIAADAPAGRQEIRATTPRGLSNPIAFEVQDAAEFTETEPNNTATNANALAVPVVINGQILTRHDSDVFRFKSDKDQKLVCEVIASRFGSMLDALLILMDSQGGTLQQNDDAVGADARIEFDAKKDTEYLLSVQDLTGGSGSEFAYRLAVKPPAAGAAAGFAARLLPDAINVHRKGVMVVRAELARVGGFSGPVRFEFQGLPPGVNSEPIVLTDATAGLLAISALADAPMGTYPVRLVASGVVGDKVVDQTAEVISGDKSVRSAYLTVLGEPPYTLEAATLASSVELEQTATIEVVAQRRPGFKGEINLAVEGFSAGRDPIGKSLDVKEVTLKPTEVLGKLTVKPKLDSEIGMRPVVIRGTAQVDGMPVIQYTRPIPLTVMQIPFVLSATLERVSVTVLPPGSESAAGEANTTIKVERRAGFAGEVALALENMPAGINAEVKNIPANGTETVLRLVATDKATAGTNKFTVVGTGLHGDRNYKRKTGQISLTVAVPEPEAPKTPAAASVAPPTDTTTGVK